MPRQSPLPLSASLPSTDDTGASFIPGINPLGSRISPETGLVNGCKQTVLLAPSLPPMSTNESLVPCGSSGETETSQSALGVGSRGPLSPVLWPPWGL